MWLLDQLLGAQPDLPYVAPFAQDAREAAAARLAAGNKRKAPVAAAPAAGLLSDWGATPEAYSGPPAAPAPAPVGTAGDWGADPSVAFSMAPSAPSDVPDMPPAQAIGLPPGGVTPAPAVSEASAVTRRPAQAPAPEFPEPTAGQALLQRLGDNQATLLALAGGFAGARTLGEGMRRAFSAAAPASVSDRQLATKRGGARETYNALIARGVPANEALAASQNPAMLKSVLERYGAGELKEINGRLVRVGPDDKVRELANYAEETKPQAGYQWVDPNDRSKGVSYIPGGEADPEVIKRNADARRDPTKATKISVADVEKMSADGQNIQQVTGFANTFKPDYANYKVDALGEAANTAGRTGILPGYKDQANWWQSYQSYKNKIRNAQFGSALTATEAAEFQKADIAPGMAPDVIQRNLARQQSIIRSNIARKAGALIEAGYDKNAVLKGYGITEADLNGGGSGGGLGVGGSTTINGVTIKRLN